jgi:hypothetical protein
MSQARRNRMADKVFVIIASENRAKILEPGLLYPFNAATKGWMEEVRIIFFGPAEKVVADDPEIQERVRDALDAGISVLACKKCADQQGLTEALLALGIEVIYVGEPISRLLKDGWASLSF